MKKAGDIMWLLFQGKQLVRIIISSFCFIIFMGISVHHTHGANCIFTELADIPLDAKVSASPGIIMFVLDDSGSMAWSMSLDNVDYVSNQGVFIDGGNSARYYVYSLPLAYKMYWKIQWSGVNRLYYNPDSTYAPWSGEVDVDPSIPQNPFFSSDHITLNNTYINFDNNGVEIKIRNSHYYVKGNDNFTYLVNITNTGGSDQFKYYKVDHSLGTDSDASVNPGGDEDKIVDGELVEITTAQAQAVGIITGRTFLEERQNFANWFAYYRKRQYTAKNAVGKIISDMSGVRIGFMGINKRIEQIPLPVDVVLDNTAYDRTSELLTTLYSHSPSGGTPLRRGLKRAGKYFEGLDSLNSNEATSGDLHGYISDASKPFFAADEGGACGQAFCILMTDGYYNGSSPGVGNKDGDNNTIFDGGKFADNYSNKLADVAMHYYERDLNTSLDNVVPTSLKDVATHQHMVTFSVSFGVSGEIDKDSYATCPIGDCPPDWWPNAETNKAKIDDMFHASVNGRGEYISASTPEELTDAMDALKIQITARLGSAAAAATNSIQMRTGTKIYQGTYYSDKWSGNLVQFSVNPQTGVIGTIDWSAQPLLDGKAWDDRIIMTFDGSNGIPFRNDQPTLPDNPYTDDLIAYLRGDNSHNLDNGGTFRVRDSKLGDIVHSAPVVHEDMIYVGANDGMLHAFNRADGEEVFAYIPKILITKGTLPTLASAGYSHQFYVDNTVSIRKLNNNTTLLVGGLSKGGKGYYCLDINENNFSVPPVETDAVNIVKWEFSPSNDDDLGYSYSRAYIVNTKAAGWVVIFSNGYDSVNQKAVLYVLDINDITGALDGGVIKIDTAPGAVTPTSDCNGLSSPSIVDVDFDGKIDYVYAGDLNGNLWKFDFTGSAKTDWKIAYNTKADYSGTPRSLIHVKNSTGGQPITLEPNIMKMECSSGQKGYLVVFGTGQYLGISDPTSVDHQTFYGIWDWQDEFTSNPAIKYLGEFNSEATVPVLSNPPTNADSLTLLQQSVEVNLGGYRVMTDHSIDWFEPEMGDADSNTDHAGWYFNLVDSGARVIQAPLIRSGTGGDLGIVTFISSVPLGSACGGSAGYSWLYQVSACNGGRTLESQFDTNGDGQINDLDKLDDPNDNHTKKSSTGKYFGNVLYKPVQVGDYLFINDSSGTPPNQVLIPPNIQGLYYWQMIEE